MEVLPFRLTGMAAMVSDDITIEIGEGHFIPKGIVETSVFVLKPDSTVTCVESAEQKTAFRIIDGYVVEEHPVEVLELDEHMIRRVATELKPLLQLPTIGGVEFGVMATPESLTVYVIDASDAGHDVIPTSDLMMSGVLSPGKGHGITQRLELSAPTVSMDVHLFDRSASAGANSTVYLAERPALELLDLANTVDATCSFVFREASVLSHLAVVLRERGIPAVAVGDSYDAIPPNTLVEVDALNPDLPRTERWSLQV